MNAANHTSDCKLWLTGAALMLATLLTGNVALDRVPDEYYTLLRIGLLAVPAIVAFAVAYKSQASGLAKALAYIPLFAGLAVALTFIAMLAGIGTPFASLPGMANLVTLVLLLFAPPVSLGAVGGWLLKRIRSLKHPES